MSLLIAITGLVTAVSSLISSIRGHQRITKMQRQSPNYPNLGHGGN